MNAKEESYDTLRPDSIIGGILARPARLETATGRTGGSVVFAALTTHAAKSVGSLQSSISHQVRSPWSADCQNAEFMDNPLADEIAASSPEIQSGASGD